MSNHNRKSNGSRNKLIAGISAVVIAALAIFLGFQFMSPTASSSNGVKSVLTTKKANTYKVNAIKYTDKGSVTIQAAINPQHLLTFSVRDTGKGMTPVILRG